MSLIFTYFNRYKRFDMDWDLGVAVHLADHFFTCFTTILPSKQKL
jgi:hypothetical protein